MGLVEKIPVVEDDELLGRKRLGGHSNQGEWEGNRFRGPEGDGVNSCLSRPVSRASDPAADQKGVVGISASGLVERALATGLLPSFRGGPMAFRISACELSSAKILRCLFVDRSSKVETQLHCAKRERITKRSSRTRSAESLPFTKLIHQRFLI